MIEAIGWIGSICFALCAAPQAWQSFKEKHSNGLSWGFLGLWLVGEIFTLVYVLPEKQYPLIFNYIVNLAFLLVIIYYKMPKKEKENE